MRPKLLTIGLTSIALLFPKVAYADVEYYLVGVDSRGTQVYISSDIKREGNIVTFWQFYRIPRKENVTHHKMADCRTGDMVTLVGTDNPSDVNKVNRPPMGSIGASAIDMACRFS